MKRREGKTGMATMSLPRALAMRSEENDISQTSNSSNLSWRQKVSEGSEFVQTRSTPSTSTSPSRSLAMRSFLADMKLSCTLPAIESPSSSYGCSARRTYPPLWGVSNEGPCCERRPCALPGTLDPRLRGNDG